MARMRPPAWPAFPDRRTVRPALRARAVLGDRGGAVERPRDRADAARVRDQRQRAAAARRSPGGRDRHHRRPRSGLGADAGRGARPRGARRHGLGRRGRDRQAHAGPRPRAGRQPQGIAGGHRRTPRTLETDLEPFERLSWAPMGMTAHVVYDAWDTERPASLSPTVIGEIIRGRIGFDGFLMSDDIGMEALAGDFGSRASGVVAAGCDVALHCSGKMEEMVAVAGCGRGDGRRERSPARAGDGDDHDRLRRRRGFRGKRRQARRAAGAGVGSNGGKRRRLRHSAGPPSRTS